MKNVKGMISLLVVVTAAVLTMAARVEASGPLDGKSYDVISTRPNGRQDENTYSFDGGKLRSALCATAGYAPAPYTAKRKGKTTTVSAVLKNVKGDTRTVNATIVGDQMKGTVLVNEAGEKSKLTFASKAAEGHKP